MNRMRGKVTLIGGTRELHKTPTGISWFCMIRRCYDDSVNDYARYGGRGITVCDRWFDFLNFLEDMGERPDRHVLDRKDNEKGYSPENCRWVTHKESARNRSGNHMVNFNGILCTMAEAAETLGFNYDSLRTWVKWKGFTGDFSQIKKVPYGSRSVFSHPSLRVGKSK